MAAGYCHAELYSRNVAPKRSQAETGSSTRPPLGLPKERPALPWHAGLTAVMEVQWGTHSRRSGWLKLETH